MRRRSRFGRSATRETLRRFFEIDAESIVLAALRELALRGRFDRAAVARAADGRCWACAGSAAAASSPHAPIAAMRLECVCIGRDEEG